MESEKTESKSRKHGYHHPGLTVRAKEVKKPCRMLILSAVLYFITHHPGLATLALTGIGLGPGTLLAIWRRQVLWCGLVVPFFLLSSISYFIVPFANALFLNAFGTRGTAVIVHKQETNEMLNESYIWDYDAVLKTADGRELALSGTVR